MENTGRIEQGPIWSARRILFDDTIDSNIDLELKYICEVDIAHLLMLAECNIVPKDYARRLIREIHKLSNHNFEPLRGQTAPRGIYLLYENYLIHKLGSQVGGVLHTARSRNDLNATIFKLRLRDYYLRLIGELLRLQAVLLRRSQRYADVTMPAYTHYQAAVPVTYGHYLAGVGHALGRSITAIINDAADLNNCPLGAGSVGGTTLPICAMKTATLLGFDKPAHHSIDSVASREVALRLLADSSILGVTLSRVASDLLLWSTAEFGFFTVPDNLVGSSSMMPQKRNVFLLEHVQGRSAAAMGAFVSSAGAMHKTPFTHSIAVGTEAVSPIWSALKATTEAAIFTRLVIAGIQPRRASMVLAADRGFASATELANRLVVDGGLSFRDAHRTVGTMIRITLENGGRSFQDGIDRWREEGHLPVSLRGLDPDSITQSANYGGGPAMESLMDTIQTLRSQWIEQRRLKKWQANKWKTAKASLDKAAHELCA